jgi:hypothetical protein
MSGSPQSRPPWRSARAHLDGNNPIVLRFSNGQRMGANLQVISVTGGLLSLSKSVDQGSRVRLMFLTEAGSVLGGAEMLPPVSDRLQPFRFISLPADDQRRVGALIGEWSQNKSELAWIEKLRAASAQHNEPAFWRFKLAGVIGLLTIGLAIAAAYLLHFGLLK